MSPWSEYGHCNAECGEGKKMRQRIKAQEKMYGGEACESELLEDFATCQSKPCPVMCKMGPWSGWGKCSAKCGPGAKKRSRVKLTAAAHGGKPCPDSSVLDSGNCTTMPCPVHCEVGAWGKDPTKRACSKSCGMGKQAMTRPVLIDPKHGGNKCPPTAKEITCNPEACPVDCQVGEWTNLGQCSLSCGGGLQPQTRKITTNVANGGKVCPDLQRSIKCNVQKCPIDCRCVGVVVVVVEGRGGEERRAVMERR